MKSRIPNTDFVINPYIGCGHGCNYCYARFMKRFTGHKEPWGTFVDVKINAPHLLRDLLKRKKKWDFSVLLSSVTDAYQPIERKYQITKQIINCFHEYQRFHLEILTRSSLVQRDLEILTLINEKPQTHVTIGMSISMIDDKWRKVIEPRASSIQSRIASLSKIHEVGIRNYLFLGPYIPGISSLEVLDNVKDFVDFIYLDRLNPRGGINRLLLKSFKTYGKVPQDFQDWLNASVEERNDFLLELAYGFKSKIKELGIPEYQIVFNTEWDKSRPI
ncbi:MAG: radical SAM protein [Candidatus Hodarchaeales archaeon]